LKKIIFGLLILFLLIARIEASERHFGFSYESPVLQAGQKELETYTNFKFGKALFYSAQDQRLEFEFGLGDGIQTSLYLNFEQEMEDDGTGLVLSQFLSDGISNEWKFKITDSLTDDFGLGLYLENGFKPDEYELETKIILDKRSGNWLGTLNVTNEPEYNYLDQTLGYSLIPSLGLGYFLVSDRLFLGLESQIDLFWYDTSLPVTRSIFSAGPVIAYSAEDWWVVVSYLPQIANLRGAGLDLVESQRNQLQLGFSIALDSQPPQTQTTAPHPTLSEIKRPSAAGKKWDLAKLERGRDNYLNSCQKCHQIHMPGEFTEEAWAKILSKMKKKARIDEDTSDSIMLYLTALSKEGK
jgi:hypothetical protein